MGLAVLVGRVCRAGVPGGALRNLSVTCKGGSRGGDEREDQEERVEEGTTERRVGSVVPSLVTSSSFSSLPFSYFLFQHVKRLSKHRKRCFRRLSVALVQGTPNPKP